MTDKLKIKIKINGELFSYNAIGTGQGFRETFKKIVWYENLGLTFRLYSFAGDD